MKRLAFIALALLVAAGWQSLSAQTPASTDKLPSAKQTDTKPSGIAFVDLSFDKAVELAAQENKLLFMDCYTDWCGPCRQMSAQIFPDPTVGEYFNPRFVSIKVNMERGEGKELRKRFNVTAYPTMIIVDPSTHEVVHRIMGSSSAKRLIERIKAGMGDDNLGSMTQRYRQGERSRDFMVRYIDLLMESGDKELSRSVATELFTDTACIRLITEKKEYFDIFYNCIDDPFCDAFKYFVEHRQKVDENFGSNNPQAKIYNTWNDYATGLITPQGDEYVLPKKSYKEFVVYMKQCGESRNSIKRVDFKTHMELYRQNGNWKAFTNTGDKYLRSRSTFENDNPELFTVINDMDMILWANEIADNSSDVNLRKRAAEWCTQRADELDTDPKANNSSNHLRQFMMQTSERLTSHTTHEPAKTISIKIK